MTRIYVMPGRAEIDGGLVALSDLDPEHIKVDPAWEHFGGAFIAGNPKKPDAIYAVADTPYVQECIAKRRLVQVQGPDSATPVNADIPVTVPQSADPTDLAWQALTKEQKQQALAGFAGKGADQPPAEQPPTETKGKAK